MKNLPHSASFYPNETLMAWAEKRGVRLEYIQPGKPQQNAYIERYNRTVRGEWLGQYIFETIEGAKSKQLNGSGLTTTSDPTWASAA
jgi:transposase InsO family protein